MTWGECRLITLQTMFANEGKTINADDSNQDYLDAMPGKANEAMMQLSLVGRPLLKSFTIKIQSGTAEEKRETILTLPTTAGRYKLDMKTYCGRWRAMDPGQIYLDDGNNYGQANDYDLEGDSTLVLPGTTEGTYTVWYHAYPVKVTASTEDTVELEMPEEAAVLMERIAGAQVAGNVLSALGGDIAAQIPAGYSAPGGHPAQCRRRSLTGKSYAFLPSSNRDSTVLQKYFSTKYVSSVICCRVKATPSGAATSLSSLSSCRRMTPMILPRNRESGFATPRT